jgi:ankyrin repeat protein
MPVSMWPTQLWDGGVCITHCHPPFFLEALLVVLTLGMAIVTRRWRFVPLSAAIAVLLFLTVELVYRPLFIGERPLAFLLHVLRDPVNIAFAYAALLALTSFFYALKRVFAWVTFGGAWIGLRVSTAAVVLTALATVLLAGFYLTVPHLLPRRVAEYASDIAGDASPRCRADSAKPVVGLEPYQGIQISTPRSVHTELGKARDWPAIYTTQMGFEHLLTPPLSIRVTRPERYDPYRAVAIEVAIDEHGVVQAVVPVAGPRELYAQAVNIASRWRFIPFTMHGMPTPVLLKRAAVRIEGPEQWHWLPTVFPWFSDWNSVLIVLERSDFEYGYRIEIRGDGSVTFIGDGTLVALQGMHCATLSRPALEVLVRDFRNSRFFDMRDQYYYATAGRNSSLAIALDDTVKRVAVFAGDAEEPPEAYLRLFEAVLQSVHADRWKIGDRFTGPSLVAEGWDFKANRRENDWMLARVARRGDIAAVRDLLDLGARAMPTPEERTPISLSHPERTALEHAAARGSHEIAQLLLARNARWSRDALGSAFVAALQHMDIRLARDLLQRGADRSGRDARGRTALMAAAAAGRPDLVQAELSAAADANAMDEAPLSALHWAVVPDYPLAPESALSDRPRVIELLIKAGAKVDTLGVFGWTPLRSNWLGYEDVTAALIAHGADVNAKDEDGLTPLMTNNSAKAAQLLLEAGADPYARNDEGQTALDIARADIHARELVPVLDRWMAVHPPRSKAVSASP